MKESWDRGILQAYLDEELSAKEMKQLEELLQTSERARQALEELQMEQTLLKAQMGLLKPPSPREMDRSDVYRRLAAIEKPTTRSQSTDRRSFFDGFRSLFIHSLGWGAAMAFVVFLGLPLLKDATHTSSLHNERPGLRRVKGGVLAKGHKIDMLFSLQRGPQSFSATRVTQAGTTLRTGDLIQFTYTFSTPVYLVIGGMNEQGAFFPLVATKQQTSLKVAAGAGTFPRRQAFQLDRYIGKERYFVVWSTRPFAWKTVTQKLTTQWRKQKKNILQPFALKKPWHIHSVWIQKHPRR